MTITLDEALDRTPQPLAAWDHNVHYGPRLCIFRTGCSGAMLIKADKVAGAERESWNDRARARDGRVGATHGHSQLAWVFENDHCGIWTKTSELCHGDGRHLMLAGGPIDVKAITQVTSSFDRIDGVHRGVRCEVAGTSIAIHEEHDPHPYMPDEEPEELVRLESAWAFHLGRDLATWLGVLHRDHEGNETNTRHLEVRAALHAFADQLTRSDAPAACTLGTFDRETFALTYDDATLTLHFAPRTRAQAFVMKRGGRAPITGYLRHFLTPARMLGAAHGDF